MGIMIDIETLGLAPDGVILSIGAVEFGEHGITKEFSVKIDPKSCTALGMNICPDTVFWWFDQSDEARRKVVTGPKIPLADALLALTEAFDWKQDVWANGVAFDIGILETAYKSLGVPPPWKFWNVMDDRTIKALVGKAIYQRSRVLPDVKHDALADAKAQALTLINMMNHIHVEQV